MGTMWEECGKTDGKHVGKPCGEYGKIGNMWETYGTYENHMGKNVGKHRSIWEEIRKENMGNIWETCGKTGRRTYGNFIHVIYGKLADLPWGFLSTLPLKLLLWLI